MQPSLRFLLIALSITILLSTVVCSPDSQKSIEINHDEDPILPKEPMVIRLESSSVTMTSGRVEYRGCYKFCVGVVSSYPYNDQDNNVWNPFNQSTNQVYYFRYVDVDMGGCQWPRWAQYPGLKIPELFFSTTTAGTANSNAYDYNEVPVQIQYGYGYDHQNDVSDTTDKYVISYPTKIQNDKFSFLIYHPDISPRNRWTVRWTGFMNTCKVNGTLPIDLHYEPDAFDAKEYITFPKWE